jgi:hypothetical protein
MSKYTFRIFIRVAMENISIDNLFDFFLNLNASWSPENGADPPPEDNQQHVELNNLINAYCSK